MDRRWGGGVEPPTNFQKGGLEKTLSFRRGWWETGGDLFEGGGNGVCNFYIKNKLKSGIFNDKKSLLAKMFFSNITTNSNWGTLTKNLVTFKR